MSAQSTFEELREFWRAAYAKLDVESGELIEPTLKSWVSRLLDDEGLPRDSPVRELFSSKPPEPYFGRWVDDQGRLSLAGKTVIVLINPGDRDHLRTVRRSRYLIARATPLANPQGLLHDRHDR